MSKVKFDTLIPDVNGKPVSENENAGPLTLGRAALIALDSLLDSDKGEDLETKLYRGELADKVAQAIREGKAIILSTKDNNFLKNRVSQVFSSSHLVFKVCEILSK